MRINFEILTEFVRVNRVQIAISSLALLIGITPVRGEGSASGDMKSSTHTINLVFVGDSITCGVGVPDGETQSASAVCAREIVKMIPGSPVYHSTQGYPGNTSFDFVPGSSNYHNVSEAARHLSNDHPGKLVFSIMLGTNDSANSGNKGAPVDAATYRKNMQALVGQLLQDFPDSIVVLNNPLWYSPNTHNGADYEGASAVNRLKSYFPEMDAMVREYQISHPGRLFRGDLRGYDLFAAHSKDMLKGEPGKNGEFYLHPNVVGAEKLGKFWAEGISAALATSAPNAFANRRIFNLDTKTFSVDYLVGKDGVLRCIVKTGEAGFPISGRVIPDELLSAVYVSHTVKHESPNIDQATVILRDPAHPLRLEVHFRVYKDESILEQWMTVTNDTKEPFPVKQLDSVFLQSPAGTKSYLEWFDSKGWGQEAKEPTLRQISKDGFVVKSDNVNRHLSGPEPWFCLGFGDYPKEDSGQCLLAAVAWSGSTRLGFTIPEENRLQISCGVDLRIPYVLQPGETLTSPSGMLTFSANGKGTGSRNFHRWMRRYGMRDGNRLRLVDNNSWEGCGPNVSEKAIVEMMKLSAALGIELYVMDDGWFGNGETARVDDKHGLGDWQLNKERFPNGLGPVLKAGKESNIAFGIWFEPEMVNPKSELFKAHPEWVMTRPGHELELERNQAVLDVANPEVQKFMFQSVSDMLTAYPGIRFVKWDANSSIHNPYSPYLGPDRQGEMPFRYMNGYYKVMAALVAKFPKVDFQTCSAGGGRADIGAMKSSHTFWPSDNTDPKYRLASVWNYTLCLPPIAATCHVTHAGIGTTKYRFDVAMMGQLGMEIDPRHASPEYLQASKTGIAAYKQVRDVIQFGDQYRYQSPFNSSVPSLNYVSMDRKRALILAYEIGEIPSDISLSVPVSGLDPKLTYKVSEINLPDDDAKPRMQSPAKVKSGEEWMKQGVPVAFTHIYDSSAITLEAVR